MLLGDIVRGNARRYPNKVAVVWGDSKYTHKELNDRVNSLANALLDIGVNKGDRLAVLADSCTQYIEIYWAGAKSGIIIVPLNNMLGGQDLAYIINNAEANTLILGQKYLEVFHSIRPQLDSLKNLIVIGHGPEGESSYEQLIASHSGYEPTVELNEDDLAYLLYTGGTTGLPKGVMLTHQSILARATDTVISLQLSHDDILLATFPIFHCAAVWGMVSHLYLGGSIVLIESLAPKLVLETIQRKEITNFGSAPSMILSLVEYPDISEYDTSSLRRILYGGAAMPLEVLKRGTKIFGNIFVQMFALTESAGPVAFLPAEELSLEVPGRGGGRAGSCGRETVGSEIRIVDEDGNSVAPGEVGEMVIGGDGIMKGYWKAPQATAEALKGGYLYTGDLATIDEEGYIYPLERKKDTIISGGEKVFPRDVEDVLYLHPSVLEAVVVGVPNEEGGESVKAIVALRQGRQATQEEIIGFCEQYLSSRAVPRYVEFVDELPKSSMGKILRRVLREQHPHRPK